MVVWRRAIRYVLVQRAEVGVAYRRIQFLDLENDALISIFSQKISNALDTFGKT